MFGFCGLACHFCLFHALILSHFITDFRGPRQMPHPPMDISAHRRLTESTFLMALNCATYLSLPCDVGVLIIYINHLPQQIFIQGSCHSEFPHHPNKCSGTKKGYTCDSPFFLTSCPLHRSPLPSQYLYLLPFLDIFNSFA